jgi:tRNA pseudouridine55 synthase
MVSAIKKDGVPLYKLARRGEEVERKPVSSTFTASRSPSGRRRWFVRRALHERNLRANLGLRHRTGVGMRSLLGRLAANTFGGFDVRDAVAFDDILRLTSDQLAARVLPFASVVASRAS